MSDKRLLRLAAGVIAALTTTTWAAAQDLSTPGAQAYYRYGCYECHGFDGKGRQPLIVKTSPYLANEETFVGFLRARADQNPLLPSDHMPNYSAHTLPDEAARAIYRHIAGFQKEDPKPADIPIFSAMLKDAGAK